MTFSSALAALRARRLTVAIGLLVGLLAAGAVVLATPRTYAGAATVYVAGIDNVQGTTGDFDTAKMIEAQRIASYRDLMLSERVLGPAGRSVGVYIGPAEIHVPPASASAVLQITVLEPDPGLAARAADAVAARFTQVVPELDRPGGPAAPPGVTVTILDHGGASATPIAPRPVLDITVGALVGLLAAIAWALISSYRDTTIRSTSALRKAAGVPVWGVLPDRTARGTTPSNGYDGGDDAFAEALRPLRATLTTGEHRPGVLVVAGPTSGAGTSTLVGALGRSLARCCRVVVVDADLRDPTHAERFGLPTSPGLADVLAGTASLEETLRPADGPDVLPAGHGSLPPGELLDTPTLTTVLSQLRRRYDVVVVDVPPLGTVLDAAMVARHTDGALLVAREAVTTAPELTAAVATLERFGGRAVGAVLTFSRVAPSDEERIAGPVSPGTPTPLTAPSGAL